MLTSKSELVFRQSIEINKDENRFLCSVSLQKKWCAYLFRFKILQINSSRNLKFFFDAITYVTFFRFGRTSNRRACLKARQTCQRR